MKTYQILLMDGEKRVSPARTLKIWPDDLPAVEFKANLIGRELARDAICDAGLYEEFKKQYQIALEMDRKKRAAA
jgi:hypothetical protein